MKLYIAGKIAGVTYEQSQARFARAALRLKESGHDTLNPFDIPACPTFDCNGWSRRVVGYEHSWSCYLRYDIARFLGWAEGVALLPGWTDSPGARIEQYVALSCGLDVRPLSAWLNVGVDVNVEFVNDEFGNKVGEVEAG